MIAVYGATGYTGRQVARQLLDRGAEVVLAGRTRGALEQLRDELGGAPGVHVAALDDEPGLRALAHDSTVMVNCAGPFFRTARPVAEAAIAGRAHYVDISAEQHGTAWFYRERREAPVALLPSFAFYSVPADLLAAVTCDGLGAIAEVEVAYAIRGWRPSASSSEGRVEGMAREWYEHDRGAPRAHRRWPATHFFDFPAPLGRRRIGAYPTPEVFTIPRHTGAQRVTTWLTTSTLTPEALGGALPLIANTAARVLRSPARPLVERLFTRSWQTSAPGAKSDDPTRFLIVVRARGEAGERTGRLEGRGIYDITAPIAVEAAMRAADGAISETGTLAPAQVLEPAAFLDALAEHGVTYELPRPEPAIAR